MKSLGMGFSLFKSNFSTISLGKKLFIYPLAISTSLKFFLKNLSCILCISFGIG